MVDVRSDSRAVRRKGGGRALTGKARADVRRFDNGFLRGLVGGLPRLTSDLALGADGQLRLSGLKRDAPPLYLSANGYRRRNGNLHLEWSGTKYRSGPTALGICGESSRPNPNKLFAVAL